MNVLAYGNLVNLNLLTKEQSKTFSFAYLSEKFYQQSTNKSLFTLSTSELGFWYHHLKKVSKEEKQFLCSFDVSPSVAIHPEENGKRTRPRKSKRKLYPEFFQNLSNKAEIINNLHPTLIKFVSRWKLFFSRTNDFTTAFWGMAKGTPKYNRIIRARIIKASEFLSKKYGYCYVCSPTIDPKAFPNNLEFVWQEFNRQLGVLCKEVSKKFNAKCLAVVESQQNLNPHGHILIFTNYKFDDIKHRYSRSGKHKYICGGLLRETIDKNWFKSISDLQECESDKVKFYLSKYIGKNTETDFEKLSKKEKWDKKELKEIATCLLPMLFGIRQVRIPQLPKNYEETLSFNQPIMSCEPKKTLPLKKTSPTLEERVLQTNGEAVVLDFVRNKSPLPCVKMLFSGDYYTLKGEVGTDLNKWNEKEESVKEKTLKKCKQESCTDCGFGLYAKQILYGGDKMFAQNTIFNIFGREVHDLFNSFRRATAEEKGNYTYLKNEEAQKAFFKKQMPEEWSQEEKEGVFLTIEHLNSCLWQFVLDEKYAAWAVDVHTHKSYFNADSYINQKNNLYPKDFCDFFPLTISANGFRIKENKGKE